MNHLSRITSLEPAFLSRLRELKASDPLNPVTIVAPSARVLHHLQERATAEGLTLLNVDWLTFHGLALKLTEGARPEGELEERAIFHEWLADAVVQHIAADSPQLSKLRGFPGLATALRSAWNDLREALVDPGALQAAFDEGAFQETGTPVLKEIIHGYRILDSLQSKYGVYDRTALTLAASDIANDARYLTDRKVLYYGFYDLTGVQVQFLEAVSRMADAEYWLPIEPERTAHAFASSLVDEVLRGLGDFETAPSGGGGLHDVADRLFEPERCSEPTGDLHLHSATGLRHECRLASRVVAGLIHDGVAPEDIDVIVRAWDGYAVELPQAFSERSIPFRTAAKVPAGRVPVLKLVRLFASLHPERLSRRVVMEWFSSPQIRTERLCGGAPERWEAGCRALPLGGPALNWQRVLEPSMKSGLRIARSADDDGEDFRFEGEDIKTLLAAVQQLDRDLRALHATDSWAGHNQRFAEALGHWLGEMDETADRALDQIYEELASLDRFDQPVTFLEWSDAFRKQLDRCTVSPGGENRRGVVLRDAMDARATTSRIRLVLGLNERVFPRAISEDPFLHDGVRNVIAHTLGNRVPIRLEGFSEERLLYHHILCGASESIHLLWQRSDEKGREKAPSLFLRETTETAFGVSDPREAPGVNNDPRPVREQLRVTRDVALTPDEALMREALVGNSGAAVIQALGGDLERWNRSVATATELEAWSKPGARDGRVPDAALPEGKLNLSPSALQTLASCPYHYYLRHRLRLRSLDDLDRPDILEAAERGTVYHRVLEEIFRSAAAGGLFEQDPIGDIPQKMIEEITRKELRKYEAENPPVFPLLRELLGEEIIENLTELIPKELDLMRKNGAVPERFEESFEGVFCVDGETALFSTHGKIDRVDVGDYIHVVDYKSGTVNTGKKGWGFVLQVAIYQQLAQQSLGGETPIGAGRIQGVRKSGSRRYLSKVEIPGAFVQWNREALLSGFSELSSFVEKGEFPVRPGDHCRLCDFDAVCRKQHAPSRRRPEEWLAEWESWADFAWDLTGNGGEDD